MNGEERGVWTDGVGCVRGECTCLQKFAPPFPVQKGQEGWGLGVRPGGVEPWSEARRGGAL